MSCGLTLFEIAEWYLSIMKSRLIVLGDKSQVYQVPQLKFLLVHFEVILQTIILTSLCLLPKILKLVLDTLSSVSNTDL